jgi:transcription initiation factor IIE alpha subunit
MSRNQSLIRVLKILRQLEAGGRYTLAGLAADLGVCERTIRRDLYALEDAGISIGHNSDTDGVWEKSYWWLVVSPFSKSHSLNTNNLGEPDPR